MNGYRAKVTSKGQVTLPVELRRELRIQPGDFIALEVTGDRAVITRAKTSAEVIEQIAENNCGAVARYASDDEAVGAYFSDDYLAEEDPGDELLSIQFSDSLLEGL